MLSTAKAVLCVTSLTLQETVQSALCLLQAGPYKWSSPTNEGLAPTLSTCGNTLGAVGIFEVFLRLYK